MRRVALETGSTAICQHEDVQGHHGYAIAIEAKTDLASRTTQTPNKNVGSERKQTLEATRVVRLWVARAHPAIGWTPPSGPRRHLLPRASKAALRTRERCNTSLTFATLHYTIRSSKSLFIR